jgi:hypothetical protein
MPYSFTPTTIVLILVIIDMIAFVGGSLKVDETIKTDYSSLKKCDRVTKTSVRGHKNLVWISTLWEK